MSDNNAYQERLNALQQKHAEEVAELQRKMHVLSMLPAGEPVVCNFREPSPIEPRAWVSFSSPAYDPERKFDPVALLCSLEEKGWKLLPEVCLIRWDTWRRAPEPCALAVAQAFTHPRGYKFTDGDAIAPYWVIPQQNLAPDFVAFMVAPDGLTYRVSVDAPRLPARISARVIENCGWWRFERGSARLFHPSTWATLHSHAYVDTEQGISGSVYFHADKAKATASEGLAELLKGAGK